MSVRIILAPHAGFCFGVERAIDLAQKAAVYTRDGKKVFTYGPLIHNPQEIERLKTIGVEVLKSEENLDSNTVLIIRSHGIPPQKERELLSKGVKIVDATCPYVKAVHEAVQKLAKEGYFVVLVGEKNHPEVIGTWGYLKDIGGVGVIVETLQDLKVALNKQKVGVIAQTTQNENFFKEVVGELSIWVEELKVINTICNATSIRQEEVRELAPKVDVMVIIGGKNSGNTTRLYKIAKSLNPNSYHIETEEELQEEWFGGVSTVGVSAGASTPKWIIERVINRIREISDKALN
ncbi:MAG TPA: 4-hydroxy-3-methylbut-2-enyl diphosphate reductase [Aquifex aeolicus]|uniref:4-hydroxy-3-methylbut-2-enyl diphosphate reductase n=1 Tax=Aquifex aeolicus TaxID=63363 RepID=A0A9D0YQ47_AQUAO|nr:4-hydroxy-3-methylbut-2-enyl diphosphate reductase [Aquifex aeolicus]HIQ26168.1 4-hydroxy-3-methylbut-2-enyl diphosphate reductase [Aquifex aeolicus]